MVSPVVAKVLKPTGSPAFHSRLSAGGLLGLDARVHSLHLEDIATPSLGKRVWRGPDDCFSGTSAHARRVLDDMASALAFVHDNGITHNDIEPGNILFSAARGAVHRYLLTLG